MKRFLRTLTLLIILGALIYQFRSTLSEQFWAIKNDFFPEAPCAKPIPYKLGTFDTQFNISKTYFLSVLTDAETVWEKPYSKQLFTYDEKGSSGNDMKINLIYDYRQQATSKLSSLGIVVENNRTSYDTLKAKYIDLRNKIALAKKNYELSPSETERIKINEMVSEINSMVVVLNRLVDALNLSVDKYNTVNGARGESFEEGLYVSDGLSREIDIYEFSSRKKLVRVLAHELGHALGLDHVDDSKAIMYKLNQGNSETLTTADLNALQVKCGRNL